MQAWGVSYHSVFVSIIFKRFGDASLIDIITESTIIANGSLNGVSTGHHYNWAVRILKLIYEGLSRLLWKRFGDYLNGIQYMDLDFELIQEKILLLRENFNKEEFDEFLLSSMVTELFKLFQYFKKKDNGPMFKFWINFLDMIELLLSFLYACCTGNWDLHLLCFRQMLTCFFCI